MTRLQTIRMSKRVTRADLAEAAGVAYNTIWRHETGEVTLGEASLFKIADALEVEPADLIDPKPELAESA